MSTESTASTGQAGRHVLLSIENKADELGYGLGLLLRYAQATDERSDFASDVAHLRTRLLADLDGLRAMAQAARA